MTAASLRAGLNYAGKGETSPPGCFYRRKPVQSLNSRRMEVYFTPDTQAQLQQLAATEGKDAARVVEETVTRMLERRAQFLEGVDRGIQAADRGEFVEDDEVRRWLEERERS